MMKQEDFLPYEKKYVAIGVMSHSGDGVYLHYGILTSISEDSLTVDTEKRGLVTLSFDIIKQINEAPRRERRDNYDKY